MIVNEDAVMAITANNCSHVDSGSAQLTCVGDVYLSTGMYVHNYTRNFVFDCQNDTDCKAKLAEAKGKNMICRFRYFYFANLTF